MPENAAERALRLLDIVPFVVSNQGISVSELAKHFSVKKEELLKDLNLLFLCGLPGYTPLELIDLSVEDDVVIIRDPQNLVAPRNFTYSEALVLRIALAALQETMTVNDRTSHALVTLRDKLERMFSAEIPSGAIHFELEKESFTLDLAKRAIGEGKSLLISYLNVAKDELTERVITPESLQVLEDRVLLDGYCHTAKGKRSFNLKYIQKMHLVEPDTLPEEVIDSTTQSISVTLTIPSKDMEFYLANSQFLQNISDNEYVIKVHNSSWLLRNLVKELGVVVKQPDELRRQVHDQVGHAINRYLNTPG